MTDSPYDPPAADDAAAKAAPTGTDRPTKLLVVAILAIVLGLFGQLGSMTGCVGSVATLATGGMPTTPGVTPEMVEAQRVMVEASRPFTIANLAILILLVLPLAVLLLGGGAMTLMERPQGRRWLGMAFGLGLFVEPLRLLLQWVQTIALWEPMRLMIEGSVPPGQGLPPEAVDGIVIGSVVLGLVFGLAWTTAKVVFYLFGRRVLNQPDVMSWFLDRTA